MILTLCDNDNTRAMWNHSFSLSYTVKLSSTDLVCSLTITNTGTLYNVMGLVAAKLSALVYSPHLVLSGVASLSRC